MNRNKNLRIRILDTNYIYAEIFKWFKESGLREIEIMDIPASVKG